MLTAARHLTTCGQSEGARLASNQGRDCVPGEWAQQEAAMARLVH